MYLLAKPPTSPTNRSRIHAEVISTPKNIVPISPVANGGEVKRYPNSCSMPHHQPSEQLKHVEQRVQTSLGQIRLPRPSFSLPANNNVSQGITDTTSSKENSLVYEMWQFMRMLYIWSFFGPSPSTPPQCWDRFEKFYSYYEEMEPKYLIYTRTTILFLFIGVPVLLMTLADYHYYSVAVDESHGQHTDSVEDAKLFFTWSLLATLGCTLVLSLTILSIFFFRPKSEQINKTLNALPSQYQQQRQKLLKHHEQQRWRRYKLLVIVVIHLTIILFALRRSYGNFCLNDVMNNDDDVSTDTSTTTESYHPVHVSSPADSQPILGMQQFLTILYCGNSDHHGQERINESMINSINIFDDVLLMLMLHPPVSLLSSPSTMNLFTVWMLSIASMVTYAIIFMREQTSPPVLILCMWLFSNVLIPVHLHGRDIKMFLMHIRLEESSKQGAQEQEEQHLTEMRYVIANVAHDLKTVSSSSTFSFSVFLMYFRST